MEAASPDLEKQGFSAVVFIYREYSVQQEDKFLKKTIVLLLKKPAAPQSANKSQQQNIIVIALHPITNAKTYKKTLNQKFRVLVIILVVFGLFHILL